MDRDFSEVVRELFVLPIVGNGNVVLHRIEHDFDFPLESPFVVAGMRQDEQLDWCVVWLWAAFALATQAEQQASVLIPVNQLRAMEAWIVGIMQCMERMERSRSMLN